MSHHVVSLESKSISNDEGNGILKKIPKKQMQLCKREKENIMLLRRNETIPVAIAKYTKSSDT